MSHAVNGSLQPQTGLTVPVNPLPWESFLKQQASQSTAWIATGLSAFVALGTVSLLWFYDWSDIRSLAWLGAGSAMLLFAMGYYATHPRIVASWAHVWASSAALVGLANLVAFGWLMKDMRAWTWISLAILLLGHWLLSLTGFGLVLIVVFGTMSWLMSQGRLSLDGSATVWLLVGSSLFSGLMIWLQRSRLKRHWEHIGQLNVLLSSGRHADTQLLELQKRADQARLELEQLHTQSRQEQEINRQSMDRLRLLETEIGQCTQRMLKLLDIAPGLILELDQQGRIVRAGGAGLRKLFPSLETLKGKTLSEAFLGDELFIETLDACLRNRDMVADAQFGQRIWRLRFAAMSASPDQETQGWLWGIDCTELADFEAQLRLVEKRLAEQLAELQSWQQRHDQLNHELEHLKEEHALQRQAWSEQAWENEASQTRHIEQLEQQIAQLQSTIQQTNEQLHQQQQEAQRDLAQIKSAAEEVELQWLEREEQWEQEKQRWQAQALADAQRLQPLEKVHEVLVPWLLSEWDRIEGDVDVLVQPHAETAEKWRVIPSLKRRTRRMTKTIKGLLEWQHLLRPQPEASAHACTDCHLWQVLQKSVNQDSLLMQDSTDTIVITAQSPLPVHLQVQEDDFRSWLQLLIGFSVQCLSGNVLQVGVSFQTSPIPKLVLHLQKVDFSPLNQRFSEPIDHGTSDGLHLAQEGARWDMPELIHWCWFKSLSRVLHVEEAASPSIEGEWKVSVPVAMSEPSEWQEPGMLEEIRRDGLEGREPANELPLLKGNVLLVEGNKDNRRILTFYLERLGLRVEGLEPASLFERDDWPANPQVILLEGQLDSTEGRERMELLRRRYPSLPLFLLTPVTHVTLIPISLRQELAGILSLPLDQATLHQMLSEHLPTVSKDLPRPMIASDTDKHGPIRSTLAEDRDCQGLLREYIDGLLARLADMRSALAVADVARLIRLSQDLRQSSLLYGYPMLGEQARLLQRAILDGQDAILIGHMLEEIDHLTNRCKSGLN